MAWRIEPAFHKKLSMDFMITKRRNGKYIPASQNPFKRRSKKLSFSVKSEALSFTAAGPEQYELDKSTLVIVPQSLNGRYDFWLANNRALKPTESLHDSGARRCGRYLTGHTPHDHVPWKRPLHLHANVLQ
jgi:hypothetical protein